MVLGYSFFKLGSLYTLFPKMKRSSDNQKLAIVIKPEFEDQ